MAHIGATEETGQEAEAPGELVTAEQTKSPNRWIPTSADAVACSVTGAFSAWLWWRGIGEIGIVAPIIGALLGIAIGYFCRSFC